MDVGPPFIANGEATKAVEPGQGALDDPAVTTQALAGVDALAGDADPDVAATQRLTAAGDVVALVGMELGRSLAPSSGRQADWGDGIEEVLEEHRIVVVGAAQERGQRDSPAVSHNMTLRARF